MVGVGLDDELVDQTGLLQRGPRGRLRIGDPLVERAVETEHGGAAGPGEIRVVRQRAVERHGRREPRFAGGEQPPHQPVAETEADRGRLLVRDPPRQLPSPDRRSAMNRSGATVPNAAVAAAGSAKVPVPPSSESRSMASAE